MAKTELPDLYTKKDVDNARTKGELVGRRRVIEFEGR